MPDISPQDPNDQGRRESVAVDCLFLDPENPRLASSDLEDPTEDELVKILWQQMAVDEVLLSIAANGYFPEEPLFVIPRGDSKDEYIAVEGNRRLTAVKLLHDEALRTSVRATGDEIDAAIREGRDPPKMLPVVVYKTRMDLWQHIGFQHVNGVKPWDSYSKSKYVADVHEEYGIPLSEIARSIGDRHATVKRLYRGHTVLRQAQEQAGFSPEDTTRPRFYFSHLYTALDQREFQELLGIEPEDSLQRDPVSADKLDDLAELLIWLYGSKATDREPAIERQNPDLNYLRDVVGSPKGLRALRDGEKLYRAWEIATGEEKRFVRALTEARSILEESMRLVSYAGGWNAEVVQDASDVLVATRKVIDSLGHLLSREREGQSPPEEEGD